MENQTIYLKQKGFVAESFNQFTTYARRDEIIESLDAIPLSINFLYVTPEMFHSNSRLAYKLKVMMECDRISLVVVDEAHLIEDKKTTRSSFAELKEFRRDFESVQWVALTTISQAMRRSLESSLGMQEPVEFIKAPTARTNIFYDVVITQNGKDVLKQSIEEFSMGEDSSEKSGIVYVGSISHAIFLSQFLNEAGFIADSYFADKDERLETQRKWMDGEVNIIVATTESFGFGIMRNSVKFVIHMCIPDNMRALYHVRKYHFKDVLISKV